MVNKIDLFIFDLDNTLIKSEFINQKIIPKYFKLKFNIELDNEDIQFIVGHSWKEIYTRYIEKYSIKINNMELIQTEIVNLKKEYLKHNSIEICPGTITFLEKIEEEAKCIVTGNGNEEAFLLLRNTGLIKYFDVVITADDYKRSKPFPDGFLIALQKYNKKPETAIVFEDSASGIIAAKRANITTCFIKEFAVEDVSSLADITFKNFIEVYEYFYKK